MKIESEVGSYNRYTSCKEKCGWTAQHPIDLREVCPKCGAQTHRVVGRWHCVVKYGWFGQLIDRKYITFVER